LVAAGSAGLPGHWTMQIGPNVYCVETVTSGKIVIVYRKDDDRGDD
jgi:hypothetical protein